MLLINNDLRRSNHCFHDDISRRDLIRPPAIVARAGYAADSAAS